MTKPEIERYISEIPRQTVTEYINYWNTIKPVNKDEYYNRFVFSHLSVHCSWRANIKAYKMVIGRVIPDKQTLKDVISYSGVGLINLRTKGMWEFKESFYNNPAQYYKSEAETWDCFRDRIMNLIHGLGYAKTAFALELCYPNEAEVTCLDVHMLRLYGYDKSQTPNKALYKEFEEHWVNTCKTNNIPPFIARSIWWDKNQVNTNESLGKYWTYVFEK